MRLYSLVSSVSFPTYSLRIFHMGDLEVHTWHIRDFKYPPEILRKSCGPQSDITKSLNCMLGILQFRGKPDFTILPCTIYHTTIVHDSIVTIKARLLVKNKNHSQQKKRLSWGPPSREWEAPLYLSIVRPRFL